MSRTHPKSPVVAVVAAGLATIGASVCCVVPLVLVLMGVSGAWISTFTALDPLRPWFSAVAILALVVAFWMLYRPAVRCGVNGYCVEPGTLRRRRRWLWLATAVIALLLPFPYYIVWIL
ncbi:mercuric transporter MerT family protein [Luteimonas dalianensis]|uniref:mercuric transporter MerT family protein n=1 Tax=Luteimonas dalianensis TaxID=1148196 RepID=UPI003BF2F9EF